jgi:hypothetical protein
MQENLQNFKHREQDKKDDISPLWADSLTIMQKRINALRRIYQRTRNNQQLRESRKCKYFEEKKKYHTEIRKDKFNSWKEYCNVTSSLTLKRSPSVLGRRRPPGTKCDPTMKML